MDDTRTPLARNRWFSPALALWFALLLGLGTLLVPAQSWEAVVAMLGIDRAVPQAQAPLGQTARMVIAVAAALVGALVGWLLARWLRARDTGVPELVEPDKAVGQEPGAEPEPDFDDSLNPPVEDAEYERVERVEPAEPVGVTSHDLDADVDRLVAGLPTVERDQLGGDPVGDWFADEVPSESGPALEAEPEDTDDPVPHDRGEEDPLPEGSVLEDDMPGFSLTRSSGDLSDLSLPELADRFEHAVRRSRPRMADIEVEARPSPVVAFPRKDSSSADPGQTLRDALRRLDESRPGNS